MHKKPLQQMAAFSTVQPPRFGTEPCESWHQTAVPLYDVSHFHRAFFTVSGPDWLFSLILITRYLFKFATKEETLFSWSN